jgi:O-antigen ligase
MIYKQSLATRSVKAKDTRISREVARVPTWLIVIVVFQSVIFPVLFGRVGLVFSSLTSSVLITFYYGASLPTTLARRDVFGLFVFLLMFMNVDAIMPSVGVSERSEFVWIMLVMLVVYFSTNLNSLFKTVSQRPILFLFISFIVLQMVWSILLDATAVAQTLQRLLFYLALFLAVANFATQNSQEGRITLLYALYLAGVTAASAMIVEYANPELYSYSFHVLGIERAAAMYINPGAGAFVISFCGLLVPWLAHAKRIPRITAFVSLSLFFLALAVTFSTQGAISVFLMMIAGGIALVPWRKPNLFIIFLIAFLIMTFVVNIANTVSLARFDQLSRDNQMRATSLVNIYAGDYSIIADAYERSGRTLLVEYSWRAIQQNPWLGYGTGLHVSDMTRDLPQFSPHNVFLLIWLEGGILALVLWVIMLLLIIYQNLRHGDDRWFRLLIIANLFVFMMSRHILFFYRYLAIILAIVFIMDQIILSKEKIHER